MTTWHITWGTYGARLHGGDRPTVERDHNQVGDEFVWTNEALYTAEFNAMNHPAVYLTVDQCAFIQNELPQICVRGGWDLRTCSASSDHVHVLLDLDRSVDGEQVRELLKRWVTQALNKKWPRPASGTWWAKAGSNKPIKNIEYLNNAYHYVLKQRA